MQEELVYEVLGSSRVSKCHQTVTWSKSVFYENRRHSHTRTLTVRVCDYVELRLLNYRLVTQLVLNGSPPRLW